MSAPAPAPVALKPSTALCALTLIVHAAGAACLWLVIPGAGGAALSLLVAALGAAAAWNRALLRGGRALRSIRWTGGDAAEFEFGDGTRVRAPIASDGQVNRLWVALRAGAPLRRSFLVARDMADPAAFRALRLWALWGGAAGVANSQLPAWRD